MTALKNLVSVIQQVHGLFTVDVTNRDGPQVTARRHQQVWGRGFTKRESKSAGNGLTIFQWGDGVNKMKVQKCWKWTCNISVGRGLTEKKSKSAGNGLTVFSGGGG